MMGSHSNEKLFQGQNQLDLDDKPTLKRTAGHVEGVHTSTYPIVLTPTLFNMQVKTYGQMKQCIYYYVRAICISKKYISSCT